MKIHLRKYYEQYRISTSRPIPYKVKVKCKLDEMVSKKIIILVGDDPTE